MTTILIKSIVIKRGGARTEIAKRFVRTILQPRIIYQAQLQRLAMKEWESLEVINKDAMRAITVLPRMTPIVTLQEHANVNTLTELIQNKEKVRNKKTCTWRTYMDKPSLRTPGTYPFHRGSTRHGPITKRRNYSKNLIIRQIRQRQLRSIPLWFTQMPVYYKEEEEQQRSASHILILVCTENTQRSH